MKSRKKSVLCVLSAREIAAPSLLLTKEFIPNKYR